MVCWNPVIPTIISVTYRSLILLTKIACFDLV
jgi:hypothetical protein